MQNIKIKKINYWKFSLKYLIVRSLWTQRLSLLFQKTEERVFFLFIFWIIFKIILINHLVLFDAFFKWISTKFAINFIPKLITFFKKIIVWITGHFPILQVINISNEICLIPGQFSIIFLIWRYIAGSQEFRHIFFNFLLL